MISAALFDFGGVILSSPFEAFNAYEAEVGLPHDTIRTVNATNPDVNAWARFERGELDPVGFVEWFEREAAELGHTVDARRVLGSLKGHARPEMVEALRRCGERLKTALLTNNFRDPDQTDGGRELRTIFEMFDEVVESSVVGVRKPEPRFYEIACERLGVVPKRVRVPRRPRHQSQAGEGDGDDDDQSGRPWRRSRRVGVRGRFSTLLNGCRRNTPDRIGDTARSHSGTLSHPPPHGSVPVTPTAACAGRTMDNFCRSVDKCGWHHDSRLPEEGSITTAGLQKKETAKERGYGHHQHLRHAR